MRHAASNQSRPVFKFRPCTLEKPVTMHAKAGWVSIRCAGRVPELFRTRGKPSNKDCQHLKSYVGVSHHSCLVKNIYNFRETLLFSHWTLQGGTMLLRQGKRWARPHLSPGPAGTSLLRPYLSPGPAGTSPLRLHTPSKIPCTW